MRDFYQEIIDIIGSGGEACCVIPIGDPNFENADHTTVTTKGTGALDGLVFTYQGGARTGWETPTIFARNQFRHPFVKFDGSSEALNSPDADAWSRDDTAGQGFSFGALVDVVDDGNDQAILTKFETTGTLLEWQFYLAESDKTILLLVDASAGTVPFKNLNETGKLPPGKHFVVGTYDGSGGASAADGINLYDDGFLNTDVDTTNNGSYVGMENLTSLVELGFTDGNEDIFPSRMGTVFFTHRTLNAVEVFNLKDIYAAMQRATPSAPWRR